MKKIFGFTMLEVLVIVCVLFLVSEIFTGMTQKITDKNSIPIMLKEIYEKISKTVDISNKYDTPMIEWGWDLEKPWNSSMEILQRYILPSFPKHKLCKNPLSCVSGFSSMNSEEFVNYKFTTDYASALIGKYNNIHIAIKPEGECISGSQKSLCGILVVDLDNQHGKNKLGWDVFLFGFYGNGKFEPIGMYKSIDEIEKGCTKEGYGDTCAAKIVKDGWKLKQIGENIYPIFQKY